MAEKQRIRPVMLVVMHGWGWREEAADNAVRQAHPPDFDRFRNDCPHAFLRTSGLDVGLAPGQENSEGQLNIGAGRVVVQRVGRMQSAIRKWRIASVNVDALERFQDDRIRFQVVMAGLDPAIRCHSALCRVCRG